MGDEIGGYTVYVQDNKLVFLYNRCGTIYKIESNVTVPTGEVDIAVKVKKDTMMNGK